MAANFQQLRERVARRRARFQKLRWIGMSRMQLALRELVMLIALERRERNHFPLSASVPVDYHVLRRSWRGFTGEALYAIAKEFPADYQKILDVFPFTEAIRKRYELFADRTPKKRAARPGRGQLRLRAGGSRSHAGRLRAAAFARRY